MFRKKIPTSPVNSDDRGAPSSKATAWTHVLPLADPSPAETSHSPVHKMAAMATKLEDELRDNAANLRNSVRSFIETMTTSRGDGLDGTSLRFSLPDSVSDPVEVIEVAGGEPTESREQKIALITGHCIDIATRDLAALTDALELIRQNCPPPQSQSPSSFPPGTAAALDQIINGNSYWRCFEVL